MYRFYFVSRLHISVLTQGYAGSLQVVHYDLNPDLWGESEKTALLHLSKIYSSTRVTNALKFDLSGISVDFNIAQIRLNHSYGVREICVKIATAFAAATLQVSLPDSSPPVSPSPLCWMEILCFSTRIGKDS